MNNKTVILARVVFVVGGAVAVLFFGGLVGAFVIGYVLGVPMVVYVLDTVAMFFLILSLCLGLPGLLSWAFNVLSKQGK